MSEASIAEASLSRSGQKKLRELQQEYEALTGRTCDAFFCPILYRDEDVPLCRAHIVNKAFRKAYRGWTIQRRDVDGFYGSLMERDFVALQEQGRHDLLDVLADPHLSRLLNAKVTVDGAEVEHFKPKGPIPEQFTPVMVGAEEKVVELALKMEPKEAEELVDHHWEVRIEKDVRLETLGAVLKAAHLTLFHMLGYRYALSYGGYFVGWTILGSFFQDHRDLDRDHRVRGAWHHFPEFVNMVRPGLPVESTAAGTVADGAMYFCGAGDPWGILVFVKTAQRLHAAVIPVFEDVDKSVHFMDFLRDGTSRLAVRAARYADGVFEVSKQMEFFDWPEARFDG